MLIVGQSSIAARLRKAFSVAQPDSPGLGTERCVRVYIRADGFGDGANKPVDQSTGSGVTGMGAAGESFGWTDQASGFSSLAMGGQTFRLRSGQACAPALRNEVYLNDLTAAASSSFTSKTV